jgi:hypothetical protein
LFRALGSSRGAKLNLVRARVSAFIIASAVTFVLAGGCDAVPDVNISDGTDTDGGPGGNTTDVIISNTADGTTPVTDTGTGNPTDSSTDGTVSTGPCGDGGVEICDDGIDNDCNNKTDCADPACTAGYACVDNVPAGWTMIAYSEAATLPACPAPFTGQADIVSLKGSSTPSCSCGCAPMGGGSCTAGNYVLSVADAMDCTGGTPASENLLANQPCTLLGTPITVNAMTNAKLVAPAGPAMCNNTVTKTVPPVLAARTCAPHAEGKGCPGTQVCVAKPTGFNICATKAGANTCTGPYNIARNSGSSDTDSRDCTACTCNLTACSSTVTISTNNNCNTGKFDNVASTGTTGTCAALGNAMAYNGGGAQYYKSTAATGGCALGTGTAPTGSLAFTGQATICCKQ